MWENEACKENQASVNNFGHQVQVEINRNDVHRINRGQDLARIKFRTRNSFTGYELLPKIPLYSTAA